MSKHLQNPGKRQAELEFIAKHTNPNERHDITTRSQNSPGQRAAQANADRLTGPAAARAAKRALDGPAKAAHAGKLSRARRNAAAKRKS